MIIITEILNSPIASLLLPQNSKNLKLYLINILNYNE